MTLRGKPSSCIFFFLLFLGLRKFVTKIFATARLSAILSHGHGLDHSVTNILVTLRCFLLIKVTRNVDIKTSSNQFWSRITNYELSDRSWEVPTINCNAPYPVPVVIIKGVD